MTTTVSVADAAQFLSLVPRLLGFRPADSLVVVPFAGSRSLGAMRVDLPRGDAHDLDSAAATVVGMVCRIPDADALTAIVYDPGSAATGLPGVPLLAAVERAADACGLRVADLLTVAADGWGSHRDLHCPVGGHPLAALDEAMRRLSPSLDARHPVLADQVAGAELPRRTAAERRTVGAAVRTLEAALAVASGIPRVGSGRRRHDEAGVDARALAAACELDDPPALFENALALDPAALEPLRAALLVWTLTRPSLRDVALVQWATNRVGGGAALEAQRRWEQGEDYPERLGRIMWGDGARPDPERLERALGLVREVAALAPRRLRPGPLALCAWLSWALGRSSHADAYARQAIEIDPDHGLAEIMLSFVQVGHLPDWAFHRRGHVR